MRSSENVELDTLLTQVPLLAPLSTSRRRRLLKNCRVVHHHAGHEVAAEGTGALAMHVIVSGEATVSSNGKEVGTLRSGDYFGEISLIDGQPRSAGVRAVSDLEVLAVPYQAFQQMLDEEPKFARALLTELCTRLRQAEQR